jgi:hypothetical protein
MNTYEDTCDGFGMTEDLSLYDKLNQNYYSVNEEWFNYKEYEEELVLELDNKPLTRPEYLLARGKIAENVLALKKKHTNERAGKSANLEAEFRKDCEIEFGFENLPEKIKQHLHVRAYESGHACGYSSIANSYPELVELVLLCKEEFSK